MKCKNAFQLKNRTLQFLRNHRVKHNKRVRDDGFTRKTLHPQYYSLVIAKTIPGEYCLSFDL